MQSLMNDLQKRLNKRRSIGNYRELKSSLTGSFDFASNDYLGLLHEKVLESAMESEMKRIFRGGAGGSRLLTGHSEYCQTLEEEIAHFHHEEAGLIFNSGYTANLGLLAAVTTNDDTVIYDQAIHASIHDALILARVKAFPFRHLDMDHLKRRLKQRSGRTFVCIESVYSCDGKRSNLREIYQLCAQADVYLIVDEAHATGWLGTGGEGAVQLEGLEGKIFARIHTFSKALGGQGAIVVGSALLKEFLINFARPFIYTTALPSESLAWIRCAYQKLSLLDGSRERLRVIIERFRTKIKEYSLFYEESSSPIQCVRIPGNHAVKSKAAHLQKQGFEVRPLLSPTVRRGFECLRICLHAFNEPEQIDALLKGLVE